jgi:hypothetical protein
LRVDGVRALLGFGPTEGEAWFELPDKDLNFAPHKTRNRALLLREWPETGPTAIVYARTTCPHSNEPRNPPHTHKQDWPKCWLDLEGWVVTRYPLPVPKEKLCDDTTLCLEQDGDTVRAVMAGPKT